MKHATGFFKTYRREIWICLALAALVWAVFGRSLSFGFVEWDDDDYVFNQPLVASGLSWKGAVWAFTSAQVSNWHPLTGLSLMLDATLFGPGPAGFHFTNVLLHMFTALALFLALRALTGSVWRSALVAALFAVHPLRAESVAWVSERKDVLSGLFFMLTLHAYAGYARRPFSIGRYLGVAALFTCGLMSKPMLVTLPCVLLLLDFWPLGRFGDQRSGVRNQGSGIRDQGSGVRRQKSEIRGQETEIRGRRSERRGGWKRAVLEKIPLLLLSAACSAVTVMVQEKAIASKDHLSLLLRIMNAVRTCGVYLMQTVWPAGLEPLYLHRGPITSMTETGLAAVALAAVSVWALRQWKRRPWLLTGWLWYLGMLLPVIGLFVQVGRQAHADRYTYLPQIGVLIMMVWTAAGWRAVQRLRTAAKAAVAAAVTAALAAAGFVQAGIWRDDLTLWGHALAHTQDNFMAQYMIGSALDQVGRQEEAIGHYRKALQLNPTHGTSLSNLGAALGKQGRTEEAVGYLQRAVELDPSDVLALNNLGKTLSLINRTDEAVRLYEQALQIKPEFILARLNLAGILARQGSNEEAARHLQQIVRLDPRHAEARRSLAGILAAQGRLDEAAGQYRQMLQTEPDHIAANNNLAWLLATASDEAVRDGAEAVRLAERARGLGGGNHPGLLDTLAAAYAEAGRFEEAQATARRAADLARSAGDEAQARAIEAHLDLYRRGLPLRQ